MCHVLVVSTLDPAYVKKGFILGSTKTSSVFFEAIIDLLLILPILYILNNYKYRNVITKKNDDDVFLERCVGRLAATGG